MHLVSSEFPWCICILVWRPSVVDTPLSIVGFLSTLYVCACVSKRERGRLFYSLKKVRATDQRQTPLGQQRTWTHSRCFPSLFLSPFKLSLFNQQQLMALTSVRCSGSFSSSIVSWTVYRRWSGLDILFLGHSLCAPLWISGQKNAFHHNWVWINPLCFPIVSGGALYWGQWGDEARGNGQREKPGCGVLQKSEQQWTCRRAYW